MIVQVVLDTSASGQQLCSLCPVGGGIETLSLLLSVVAKEDARRGRRKKQDVVLNLRMCRLLKMNKPL